MPGCFIFDVDETLEVSAGPVPIQFLRDLRKAGHVVGVCGNWARFIQTVPDWAQIVTVLGPIGSTKTTFLEQLTRWLPCDRFVMVGNDNDRRSFTSPNDKQLTLGTGFEFVPEQLWYEIEPG